MEKVSFLQLAINMSTVSSSKPWLTNTFLTPSLSEVLVSTTRGAVTLVFVVKVDFLCVGSRRMVPGKTFPGNCCPKAELATLELQEQPLFDP